MSWIILFLVIFSFNVQAENDSTYFTKNPKLLTISTTFTICDILPSSDSCPRFYLKIILAKQDAAFYVANNNKISTSYLEQALIVLRKKYPNSSDMELAQAILAY